LDARKPYFCTMTKQVRNTTAKAAVIDALSISPHALSHGELFHQLEEQCDRVTIYRILDRLVSEGLAHRIALSDGTLKYALCEQCGDGHHHSHAHLHFNCLVCGGVTCLESEIPKVQLPRRFKMHDVSLVVNGICATCHV
jgi:Fur family transcriptional regulator, ferric uptake regulator